ncbi:PqqD family peptide modification chaperone [Streptomyces sp. BA2]|uniref:PqqD family peptide modification chaperone n=1 Tax=Streptomyces sp. BA2 TaxID=436595 RepID=UPI00136D2AC9|nr:PqqD family peptide modification chaperone [Streptomyces sp. BA2]
MPLIHLAEQTVFDPADGTGVLLDTAEGVYFELNPTATLMLAAALHCETYDEAVRDLTARIDAADGELREGIRSLAAQLSESGLTERGLTDPGGNQPRVGP